MGQAPVVMGVRGSGSALAVKIPLTAARGRTMAVVDGTVG